jgi:hypothetical protein
MASTKKNIIWITRNSSGYCIDYNGSAMGKSKSSYNWPDNSTFLDAIDLFINTSGDFYEPGIKLTFNKDSTSKIPLKEKEIIETLIRRFEDSAKERMFLQKDLKDIKKISSKYY